MLRLALATLALAAAPALAQPRAADLVTWRVRAAQAAPGETARVVLDARIAPGWRLYALDSPVGLPLTLTVERTPDGVEAAAPVQSAPRTARDEALGEDYTYFADRARVTLPLAVGRGVERGRHAVVGTVRYALCDDSICLPPASTPFRAPLVVR